MVVREQKKRKVAGGKISKSCEICKAILPSVKSMEIHYESKHSKINFNPDVVKHTLRVMYLSGMYDKAF